MMADLNTSVRRTPRTKKPSLKAMESLYISKLKNSGFIASISSDSDEQFYISSNSDEEEAVNIEKPKLLHDNEVVHGEEIFQLRKPKQRCSLAQKVAETNSANFKTSKAVRSKLQKKIATKVLEGAGSGSEYEISEESTEESDGDFGEEDSSESSEEEGKEMPKKTSKSKYFEPLQTSQSKSRGRLNYTIRTDEYFSNYSTNKTSNNTLDKLETPRLPQQQLQSLLSNKKLSKPHRKALNSLSHSNKNQFRKWLYLLNEGFNILLFGLGSKKNTLKTFHMEYLKEMPVIVVNGFFPTLLVKNVLDTIGELLEIDIGANVFEACDQIEQQFNYVDSQLYLIIHNIEGEMLRNFKSQSVLARLSAIKNVHLIASIDHINGPLIWDQNRLSKFNYIWWDITSFLPYMEETSFERSMMVQKSGNLALSSLRNVFLSLTANSKSIYLIIVKFQLENSKNQYYQGLAFKDLYMSCREAFIVSSDLALRAQLTEFVDHKMVKLKRSVDGTEYLLIPLQNSLLQKFLDEQN